MEIAEEHTHTRNVPDDCCWIELTIARKKSNVLDEMRWCDFTNCRNTAHKQITDEVVNVARVRLKRGGCEAAFDA